MHSQRPSTGGRENVKQIRYNWAGEKIRKDESLQMEEIETKSWNKGDYPKTKRQSLRTLYAWSVYTT